jgi:hypothetical protein
MTVTLTEEQRQAVLLAIAHTAVERPRWYLMLTEIARALDGAELFDRFKELREISGAAGRELDRRKARA